MGGDEQSGAPQLVAAEREHFGRDDAVGRMHVVRVVGVHPPRAWAGLFGKGPLFGVPGAEELGEVGHRVSQSTEERKACPQGANLIRMQIS